MTPAAETLEVRLERIEGERRRRRIGVNVAAGVLGFVLGLVLGGVGGAGGELPLRELVIARRGTGEVLARGDMTAGTRDWFVDVMGKDLRRLDEAAFLARWGDPLRWARLARTWPPRDDARGRIPPR